MFVLKSYAARSHRRSLLVAIFLVAIAVLACLVSLGSNSAPIVPSPNVPAQTVSTCAPSYRLLSETANVHGIWVPREEVIIASPLEGLRVAQVLVESGDSVSPGQVLARLERTVLDSQARQAEQLAIRARAENAQAIAQYERTQRLLPAGAVSRQDYEAVQATMLAAKAGLEQALAAWEEQRTRQAHTDIRAPFAGTITLRDIQVGAMVSPQSAMFRLASNQPPEFLAQIPQQLLPGLSVGMAAQVSTGGKDSALTGAVRLLSTNLDPTTGYGQSRITLSAAPPSSIRPGSVGVAQITLSRREVLAVDVRALRYASSDLDREQAQPYVFVVEAGRAKRVAVRLGLRDGDWVEVLEGLDTHASVVTAGATLLQDGDEVQPHLSRAMADAKEARPMAFSRRLLWPWYRQGRSLLMSLKPEVRA